MAVGLDIKKAFKPATKTQKTAPLKRIFCWRELDAEIWTTAKLDGHL